jgi:hypothetical protein
MLEALSAVGNLPTRIYLQILSEMFGMMCDFGALCASVLGNTLFICGSHMPSAVCMYASRCVYYKQRVQ